MTSDRELTMAELAAQAGVDSSPIEQHRPDRDDELLADPPETDHHLGRFAGWRAARQLRWFVGVALAAALLAGLAVFILHTLDLRQQRVHPLPELEATITPGTAREMTVSDGNMRVGLAAEAPAINILHLPDRDISLAPGVDKAQFKVEVLAGTTVKLVVLTGNVVETLTRPDAQPLLDPPE